MTDKCLLLLLIDDLLKLILLLLRVLVQEIDTFVKYVLFLFSLFLELCLKVKLLAYLVINGTPIKLIFFQWQ